MRVFVAVNFGNNTVAFRPAVNTDLIDFDEIGIEHASGSTDVFFRADKVFLVGDDKIKVIKDRWGKSNVTLDMPGLAVAAEEIGEIQEKLSKES